MTVAQETGEAEPLPCAIIAAGDDATPLETSLIENIARLDPDEVKRWENLRSSSKIDPNEAQESSWKLSLINP